MVKKGDFIEIIFVGKIKETGQIFDLNDMEEAKKNNIYDPKQKYEPVIVCVGKGDVVKGLDYALEGKEVGKEFTVEVSAEEGFGKRDAKQVRLLSASSFKEQEMKPYPGMPISLNDKEGIITSVSGGRIMVDFNHPLAGRNLQYTIKITKIVENDDEKVKAFMKLMAGNDLGAHLKGDVAYINMKLPGEVMTELEKKLKERLPKITKVEQEVPEKKEVPEKVSKGDKPAAKKEPAKIESKK
ncbi:MAG: peptidylprolyl isomerase [Candidatus Woesearchaeota archaeon]